MDGNAKLRYQLWIPKTFVSSVNAASDGKKKVDTVFQLIASIVNIILIGRKQDRKKAITDTK